jgi:hypothetical protein
MSRRCLATIALSSLALVHVACQPGEKGTPLPVISDVRWVVPSSGLPADVVTMPSNNCIALATFEGRLYLAFRSAPTHFASALAQMYVLSSGDGGLTWQMESEIAPGTDVREPHFLAMPGLLIFYYVELGTDPAAFEPKAVYRMTKPSGGAWSSVVPAPLPAGMVVWEIKQHAGAAYLTGYLGNHYSTSQDSGIDVYFKRSTDGLAWEDVDPASPVVYHGGVSEVGFEFDASGDLWAVTRNEDGDQTGFGSQVAFAPAGDLGHWQFPALSSPYRYDSPRMLRNGEDLYLVARRNIVYDGGGDDDFVDAPYDAPSALDAALPMAARRDARLAAYSALPKRTSIYKIDTAGRSVVWQKDLPSASDTSFPAIVDQGAGSFLLANYTNPVDRGPYPWAPDTEDPPSDCQAARWPWIEGQTSITCGTRIYLATLQF